MNNITTDNLRRMENSEGLILQGCGGDLNEWVDGINEMLTQDCILLDGTKFDAGKVCTFKNEGLTNLLFPFDDSIKLDMGKLAMWRLQTHDSFGGTWLSDFIENELDGYIDEPAEEKDEPKATDRSKPNCPLIGVDGNIFGLVGIAARTLRENGMREEAKEMSERVFASHSYDDALCIIGEYVNITSVDEEESEDDYYNDEDCDEDEDEGMGECK